MPRLPDLAELPWSAQVARFTVFLQHPFEAAGLWQLCTGELPTIDEHRPRDASRRQAGPYADAFLELQSSSQRLDFLLTPAPPSEGGIAPQQTFAPVAEALTALDRVVVPWIESGPNIAAYRLALGIVVLLPVPSRETAYEQLQRLLPCVKLDPGNCTQFLYQINRPKPSRSLPGVKLNRLTTWNAIVFHAMGFTIQGPAALLSTVLGPDEDFVRVECDNSTPPERTSRLDASIFLPIYQELKEMALENIQKGELP